MALARDGMIFKHLFGEDAADGFELCFEVSGRGGTVRRDGSLGRRGARSR
jgi:hypothetical protein